MGFKELLSFWNINFAADGDHSLIAGSPNRTECRFLFRDDKNTYHIAEGYPLHKRSAQIRQNLLLEHLTGNHLSGIYPFYRTLSGEHGVVADGLFWQVRPYIPAEAIPRSLSGTKEENGLLWGNFLLQLENIMEKSSPDLQMPNAPFLMSDFLPELLGHARRNMPEIIGEVQKFDRLLSPFFQWERNAEKMFAHGDFHPGNILVKDGKIKIVIDWEFAGMKFPGYDMALLIGCLGMDHPDNLSCPAVRTLQDLLYRQKYMPDDAWELLPQLIAATRMGWLGEWLTLRDETLVRQELELLSILLEE